MMNFLQIENKMDHAIITETELIAGFEDFNWEHAAKQAAKDAIEKYEKDLLDKGLNIAEFSYLLAENLS